MLPIGDQNQPGRGIAWATLVIIGINVGVFLLLQDAGAATTAALRFTYGFSTIPY
jgi:hypothetical protein